MSVRIVATVLFISSAAFGGEGKFADAKEKASEARLCRSAIAEQLKALPKGPARKGSVQPLIDKLRSCNS